MRVSGWKLELAMYCCQINHQDQTIENNFTQKLFIEEHAFLLWHKDLNNTVVVLYFFKE